MNKNHRTSLIASILMSALFSSQVMAETVEQQSKRNEFYGVGSGFIVGAVLGGPVGAIIASFTGAAIADNINGKNRGEALKEQLTDQQIAYEKLQQEYHVLLAATQTQGEEQQVASVEKIIPLESQIQFTTASDVLKPHYQTNLMTLANAMVNQEHIQIQLFGYADRRGDSEYNQRLSEKRVMSVRQFLLNQGVSELQIDTTSYGEEQPLLNDQNKENDFFDRRVVMRVKQLDRVMTAAH